MIVFANANGETKLVQHTQLIQGSNNFNKLTLIAPFPADYSVYVNIRLPNGEIVTKFGKDENLLKMENIDLGDYVLYSSESAEINAWSLKLERSFTQMYGEITIQFFITGIEGMSISCNEIKLSVSRGVPNFSEYDVTRITVGEISEIWSYANGSATNAAASATNAAASAEDAKKSLTDAITWAVSEEEPTAEFPGSALFWSRIASGWAVSEEEPSEGGFPGSARYWATNAAASADAAATSSTNAAASATNAADSAEDAKSYLTEIISIVGEVDELLDDIIDEQHTILNGPVNIITT